MHPQGARLFLMSLLNLGGAAFGGLDQKAVDSLITTAIDAGVTRIDTAPLYGDSEIRIGQYLRKNRGLDLKISTKVGIPASLILDTRRKTPRGFTPGELSPSIINESVKSSITKLKVDDIDTLYLHSIDSAHFTDENMAALANLKRLGLVKHLGYAGDGFHLECAQKQSVFDTFMMTLNCIDQMNMPHSKTVGLESRIVVKRALGSAVWRSKNYSMIQRLKDELAQIPWLDKNLRALLKANTSSGFTSYEYRFNKMFGRSLNQDFTCIFLNFALSIPNIESVLVGTTSLQNLSQVIEIEREIDRLVVSELALIESNFEYHANKSWAPQT